MNTPRRNDSGQPYGVVHEKLGNRYINLIFSYYSGRSRRFNISVERMVNNFSNDAVRSPDKYSDDEFALISELKSFDMKSNDHIIWMSEVFKLQSQFNDVSPLCKELVDELDYALGNENSGFLNDDTYKGFRQELIGELARIYDEPINFLGAILRTLALSGGFGISSYSVLDASVPENA